MASRKTSPPAPSPATGEGKFHRDNVPAARRLRVAETPTETTLWECLRARRCLNLKFRPQHPVGKFVLDFYCEERKVAIEIDGGYHLDPEQRALDLDRQAFLEGRGVRFIRIPTELVSADRTTTMRYLIATLSALN